MSVHEEAQARRRLSLSDAIDHASQYFGFHGVMEIEHADEVFEVKAKVFWSPEQIAAMAELDDWVKTLDHDVEEVRNPLTNEIIVHPDTGKPLTEKVPVQPYRSKGKLVKPSYESRYLAALWGEEKARRFEQGGGTYGLVGMLMAQMDDEYAQWRRNRQQSDSKSS
jgi:hypothetical protein